MKKFIAAIATALPACFILLAGCGSLSFLVPDQKVNDPLKLSDVHLPTFVVAGGSQASGTLSSDPFANLGSAPANPKSFTIDQPIAEVFITGPGAPYPASVTISNVSMTLVATDSGGQVVTLPPATISTPITLTQISSNEYSVPPIITNFHIDPGSQAGALLNLLTTGGTNVVSATVTFHVDTPGIVPNTQFQILFGPGVGTAKF